jgi:hypothetical protein
VNVDRLDTDRLYCIALRCRENTAAKQRREVWEAKVQSLEWKQRELGVDFAADEKERDPEWRNDDGQLGVIGVGGVEGSFAEKPTAPVRTQA